MDKQIYSENKMSDLFEKLENDESFLDSPEARKAFCFSYFLTLIEI